MSLVETSPQLSIGICAYNEAGNIAHLLQSILDDVHDCEVIVVASGCTDGTDTIVRRLASEDDRIRLMVEEKRNGKSSAINMILDLAKGSKLLFVSGDTMPSRGSIARLAEVLGEERVGLASARVLAVSHSRNLIERTGTLLWHVHDIVQQEQSEKGDLAHVSDMFCGRTAAIDRVPPGLVNDDSYIAMKVKGKGLTLRYVRNAVVRTVVPRTPREYMSQRRRIIYGHFQVRKFTGTHPQYLPYFFLHDPRSAMRSIVVALARRFDLAGFVSLMVLETLAFFSAVLDVILKKTHNLWSYLASTKVPVEGE